jgi:hypothetical protein
VSDGPLKKTIASEATNRGLEGESHLEEETVAGLLLDRGLDTRRVRDSQVVTNDLYVSRGDVSVCCQRTDGNQTSRTWILVFWVR